MIEALKQRNELEPLKEILHKKHGVAKEDLTFDNNASLYTTAVSAFVEKRLRPVLLASGVIRHITDFRMKGFNSIKVPIRSALITAATLPDNGVLSYDNGTYSNVPITIGWIYAANKLGHELIQHSAVELMAEELGEIGDALARKIDSDIIAAIDAACTAGNSNDIDLGVGTYITFTAFANALGAHMALYAMPDVFLTNPTTWVTLIKDTDVKTALARSSDGGRILPGVTELLNMRVLVSPQVGASTSYLIDTARLGYFLEGAPTQTFDGRRSGELNYEVIGATAYGVAIVQPKAAYAIRENNAA
jgi:hypothetical protein